MGKCRTQGEQLSGGQISGEQLSPLSGHLSSIAEGGGQVSVEQLSGGEQMSSEHLSPLKFRVSKCRVSICRVTEVFGVFSHGARIGSLGGQDVKLVESLGGERPRSEAVQWHLMTFNIDSPF